jgi:hypothetical protein
MGLAKFGAGENNFCGGCGASNADGCTCASCTDTTSAAAPARPYLTARPVPLQWHRDPCGGRTRGVTCDGFELIVHDDGRWAVRRCNEVMVTASGAEPTAVAAQLRVVAVYMALRT